MSVKILITGASGFVGGKIAESLAKDSGYELYILLRDPDKKLPFSKESVRICKGDITKPETLKGALAGKEVVIHCAALMSNFDYEPRSRFFEVNVTGTKNLLEQCDKGALRQFIHISTTGVLGATDNNGADESAPYGKDLSVYEWSKKESEKAVLDYCMENKMAWTILRPSQLYGPGMRYGWPETIAAIRLRKMAVPGGGKGAIHLLNIYDFVKAVRSVILNSAAMNKVYNIAGPEKMRLGEVFGIIAGILNVRAPRNVPYMPVYLAAVMLEALPSWMKTRKLRLLTAHRVKFFSRDHVYNISRAVKQLGYAPTVNAKSGFADMINWCKSAQLV